MIARRRWPNPTLPQASVPRPSGPRWASTSVIASSTPWCTASSRSRLTMATIPHIRALALQRQVRVGLADAARGVPLDRLADAVLERRRRRPVERLARLRRVEQDRRRVVGAARDVAGGDVDRE